MLHLHMNIMERRETMNRSYNHNYHTPGFDSLNDLIPLRTGPGNGILSTLRRYFTSDRKPDVPTKH